MFPTLPIVTVYIILRRASKSVMLLWALSLLCVFAYADNSNATSGEASQKIFRNVRVIKDQCNIQCNLNAKYRPIDGSCNNRENPCWGKSERTFTSLLPPQYSDGIGCPRTAPQNNPPFPLVRLVSSVVHHSVKIEARKLSHLFTSFGQFQAHDTGLTPNADEKNTYDCPLTTNNKCRFNIEVPKDDQYLPGGTCAYFPLDVGHICEGTGTTCGCSLCKKGQLQFVNEATSFLDGSNMYGPTESRTNELRQPETAYLKMEGDLLSRKDDSVCTSSIQGCNSTCFNIGDVVGNGNFLLISMYTMMYREHNRLVDKLQPYYPNNNVLFYEVRKIIGAMIQHIVYNEYLPLLFGKCMDADLQVPTNTSHQYDPTIDPTTTTECNFAACRYGHTEIKGRPTILGEKTKYSIGDFGRLDMFCKAGSVDRIIGGLTTDHSMEHDQYVENEVLNRMNFSGQPLSDLVARGLLRARTHAIPTYLEMFEYCGLKPPKNYEELRKYIADEAVEHYRQVYGENGIANIELYSAILSEKHIPQCEGILGYITSCIVADHHRRHKFGDRLWYENLNQPESLTKEQIKEIQKTTIARIICSNTNMTVIQKEAFEIANLVENMKVSCNSIIKNGDIDSSKWKPL